MERKKLSPHVSLSELDVEDGHQHSPGKLRSERGRLKRTLSDDSFRTSDSVERLDAPGALLEVNKPSAVGRQEDDHDDRASAAGDRNQVAAAMNKQRSVYARLAEMLENANGGAEVSEKDQDFLRKLGRRETGRKDSAMASSRGSEFGVNIFNDFVLPAGAPLISPRTKYGHNEAYVRRVRSKVGNDTRKEFKLSPLDVEAYNGRNCASNLDFRLINETKI